MIINLILVIVWIYLYAFEKMRLVKTLKSEIMMYRKFLLTSVLLFISMVAFAQSRITGYVTDPQGEPIIGANVVIKVLLSVLLQTLMVNSHSQPRIRVVY